MDIKVDKTWREKTDGTERKVVMVEVAHDGRDVVWVNGHGGNGRVWIGKPDFLARFEPVPDMVNHPPHYKDASGIECIEVTKHMQFCGGNCFKYLYRAGSKGDAIEDLKKAAWYAEQAWFTEEVTDIRLIDNIVKIAEHRNVNIADAMYCIYEDMWAEVKKVIEDEIARLESEQ